jgi:cytochrome P450
MIRVPFSWERNMLTRQITIQVTPEAAGIYESASRQERRKLDALLSLRLTEARQTSRSIEEIMREATAEARENGLTEDILNEILSER